MGNQREDSAVVSKLARHARPYGHDDVRASIRYALSRDRLHHALLLIAPEGSGKLAIALEIAQTVSCERNRERRAEGGDFELPCLHCSSCRRMAKWQHPDLMVISSQKKAIRIETIRELQQKVAFQPHESPVRTVIICDTHKLLLPSANALLKILEEPPTRTRFILLTDREQLLLSTITSRCTPMRLKPFRFSEVVSFLSATLPQYSEQTYRAAALLCHGNLRRALVYCVTEDGEDAPVLSDIPGEDDVHYQDHLLLTYFDVLLKSRDPLDILELSKDIVSQDCVDDFFILLETFLRQCLHYRQLGQCEALPYRDELVALANATSVEDICHVIMICEAFQLKRVYNVKQQLSLEVALLEAGTLLWRSRRR